MHPDSIIRGQRKAAPFFILLLFFSLNLLFLDGFPFVHSDESWLAGLTLEMMHSGSPAATETFFDLFPRHPHAVKLLYHLVQMPFIALGGYSIFSVRLVSLVFGCLALYVFFRLLRPSFGNAAALTGMVLLAVNLQFIYASHFARQESAILFFMLLSFLFGTAPGKRIFLQGLCIALAIGFHPNSFIIFIPNLLLLIYRVIRGDLEKRMIGRFLLPVTLGAAAFAALSLAFDPGFIGHYLSYGGSVGISSDPVDRIGGFFRFYLKLFYAVTGTYYVPEQKALWIFYALVVFAGVLRLILDRRRHIPLLPESLIALTGVNLGYLLIGKYSQPSVVFIIPFVVILFLSVIHGTRRPVRIILPAAAGIFFLLHAVFTITAAPRDDYRGYLAELEKALPEEGAVLVNLNAGFLFEDREFYDYRNLAYLEEADLGFEEYVRTRGITAIVVPEELVFIYERRPVWNIMYGNIVPWYLQMLPFLEEHCSPTSEFTAPCYGMRITRYMGDKPWQVKVYRVKDS